MFNVITRKTLIAYMDKYPLAKNSLSKWYSEIVRYNFSSFNDLKEVYTNASLVADNRVVFNIKGNKYRLIVKINYDYSIIWIRFVGTHAEYDKIDATKI